MKNVAIQLILLYRVLHQFVHPILYSVFGFSSTCKYPVSCSQYTIHQIKKHGTITGLKRGMVRVLSCH